MIMILVEVGGECQDLDELWTWHQHDSRQIGVGCDSATLRVTPRTSVQATKRMDCHFLQWDGCGRSVPSHSPPPTHPLYNPFPGSVQTGGADFGSRPREEGPSCPSAQSRRRSWSGDECWGPGPGEQPRQSSRPASEKRPLLSVEARPGGGSHKLRPSGWRAGLLPSSLWGLRRVYGPSSDLTNPFTIHHLQQLVWLRSISINSPSDRRCLCRFSNKPPGPDPSPSSINTAACGPTPRPGPSWAQQPDECGLEVPGCFHLALAPSSLPSARAEGPGGLWLPPALTQSLPISLPTSSSKVMGTPAPHRQPRCPGLLDKGDIMRRP